MSRRAWVWIRVGAGVAILALLVWRLGAGPFVDGLRRLDARSLTAAALLTLLTTVCCAWRWSLVARGLGVPVGLPSAVGAYYRSQFLNTTLPGGVVGDVHRAVRHGRDAGDVGRGLRAVAWERTAGQCVQLVLALVVLVLLPSPLRSSMPWVAAAVVVVAVGAFLVGRSGSQTGSTRWARIRQGAAADLHDGLLARNAWPGIVLASVLVVVGHTATFLLAARVAGSTASITQMLPLALLVLLAMSVPTNIGGWGPREGVAAWAFAAAGLGASLGLTTAVVYGAMVLVASLPGALVLLVSGWRRHARASEPAADAAEGAEAAESLPVLARTEAVAHG